MTQSRYLDNEAGYELYGSVSGLDLTMLLISFRYPASTICPRSLDPFQTVIHNVKWAKPSWSYSTYIPNPNLIKNKLLYYSLSFFIFLLFLQLKYLSIRAHVYIENRIISIFRFSSCFSFFFFFCRS